MNKTANKPREYTAGELTTWALAELDRRGIECWRSNNIAVKGRRFIGRKGVPDIMGFSRSTGLLCGCEIKKIGDTLKPDQKELLGLIKASGAIALICRQEGSKMIIDNYQP